MGVPPGLWGQRNQFTSVEAKNARALSAARVHVERMIGFVYTVFPPLQVDF